MPFKKYRVLIEIIFLWTFPFISLYLLHGYFSNIFSPSLATFMLLFPALTMYLVVGTGAGYCKFWYFTTTYAIKGVTPTIGLIYSAVINVSAFLVIDLLKGQNWVFIPLVGIGTAAFAIFIDIFLLGSGLFYLKSKKFPLGSNPVKHAFSYGSWFFTVVGMWNATGIFLAYQFYLKNQFSLPIFLLVLPLLFALPFMFYFIRKRNMLKRLKLVYGE